LSAKRAAWKIKNREQRKNKEEDNPMYESGDLKKGLKVEIDGAPYVITQFQFVKPGKGQALYKCRLKNMVNGSQFDRTFRSGEKFNEANLEQFEMEYLYSDGEAYCFMNTSTYNQEFLTAEQVAEAKGLLKENTLCQVLFFDGKAIGITLPNFIDLRVVKSDPWAKGDTASGSTKPATLETGYVLQVPPFVEEGELIRIDTRTGEYSERVKG
jgi:elongation factor P